jgi:hypothetical protein
LQIQGDYQLEPASGEPKLQQAAMHVAAQQVTVEYQRVDGARFRATYRISKRGKTAR